MNGESRTPLSALSWYVLTQVINIIPKWQISDLNDLDFVECCNVHALHIIFKTSNLLLKVICANFVILYDAVDYQLLDAITNWCQLRCAPEQAVHLHTAHTLLQLCHVSLVIPRLDVKQQARLGNHSGFFGFLFCICCKALLFEFFCFFILFLVITTKELKVIVIFLLLLWLFLLCWGSTWSLCRSRLYVVGGLAGLLQGSDAILQLATNSCQALSNFPQFLVLPFKSFYFGCHRAVHTACHNRIIFQGVFNLLPGSSNFIRK